MLNEENDYMINKNQKLQKDIATVEDEKRDLQ